MALAPAPSACPRCGTEVPPRLLRCPACSGLVYAEELKRLASEAQDATERDDPREARALWEKALELLPPEAEQRSTIEARIAGLQPSSRSIGGQHDFRDRAAKGGAAVGALGLLAWKSKFVLAFVLTKGKLLLAGFGKSSAIFGVLASVGVYWAAWGWKFAVGLVASIYVHEMGHVVALRRFGIRADAPMFVPGLGAFVRMRQMPRNAAEDARVGLAGPWFGLGAAGVAFAAFLLTGSGFWAALARFGAWINLFNLLPIWQLDGARAFRALTTSQRVVAAAAIGVAWFLTAEGLLLLLLLAAVFQAFSSAPDDPDHHVLAAYVVLVLTLAWLSVIVVPV